ncbi:MAG: hypothetical protein GY751_06165 [Bacteroidetes bacterium]|nr:hypothetical protein [Bacteroidota bacterium]
MKNWLLALTALFIVVSSCKDTSAPSITILKANGIDIGTNNPVINASRNESATFQVTVNDDEELLQFITYIDTTGLGDKERLFAQAVSGTEDYVEFEWEMSYVDSLGDRHYFGQPTPIIFTVLDNNQNSESVTVTFNIN